MWAFDFWFHQEIVITFDEIGEFRFLQQNRLLATDYAV